MEIPALVKNRFHLHLFIMKAIVLSVFTLALLGGSACTKVHVVVHVPSSSSSLTGLNCKLQRELRNQHQKTDFWCWAAAAQTVIEYLKQEPVRQCELVEAALRHRSMLLDEGDDPSVTPESAASLPCCTAEDNLASLADPPCPANGLSEYVFDTPEFRMGYIPITFDWTSSEPQGLSWDEIVTEICEDRPIVSAIAYSGESQGGHARVIGGYKELDDGSQWLQVYDPYSTSGGESFVMSYDAYLGIPGVFANARTYTAISLQH